tara:strand:+ start:282 stop:686 length:405 start_codon:yes stop_codon:yes gene_type:complete
MKLTKSQLKQLIKEELQRTLNEADVIKGPWPGSGEEKYERDENDPWEDEIPGEYILDELAAAAMSAIIPLAVEKLKNANAYNESGADSYTGSPTRLSATDIELEIEEGIMDALKPLSQTIYYKEKDNQDDQNEF